MATNTPTRCSSRPLWVSSAKDLRRHACELRHQSQSGGDLHLERPPLRPLRSRSGQTFADALTFLRLWHGTAVICRLPREWVAPSRMEWDRDLKAPGPWMALFVAAEVHTLIFLPQNNPLP